MAVCSFKTFAALSLSKCPFRAAVPAHCYMNVFWHLKPSYLDNWSLKGCRRLSPAPLCLKV